MNKDLLTEEDKALWDNYIKTVIPLKKSSMSLNIKDLFSPRRWFIKKTRQSLPTILDLHQMTIQESFQIFNRFLEVHLQQKTPKITIITGRGKNDSGKIKKELPLWLENKNIKEKIKAFTMKNEGSFEIELRKKC